MTGINSAVTGKFCDPPVIMTGITPRFISRPAAIRPLFFLHQVPGSVIQSICILTEYTVPESVVLQYLYICHIYRVSQKKCYGNSTGCCAS